VCDNILRRMTVQSFYFAGDLGVPYILKLPRGVSLGSRLNGTSNLFGQYAYTLLYVSLKYYSVYSTYKQRQVLRDITRL